MDWIDTLMLESKRGNSAAQNRLPATDRQVETTHALSARLIAVQGISLIHVTGTTREEISSALELLRGFRATGRRIALCDTANMVAGRQLGRELVEGGTASAVISCGAHGRDLAIGARDAGLDLSSVMVCRDSIAACEVLSCRLAPGDTVLVWGVGRQMCDQLVAGIEKRFASSAVTAA